MVHCLGQGQSGLPGKGRKAETLSFPSPPPGEDAKWGHSKLCVYSKLTEGEIP